METLIGAAVDFVLQLAVKYPAISIPVMVVGGFYLTLTALRGVLTTAVKLTATTKDDSIVFAVYAFCDKFAYGFGKLAEYFEHKTKSEKVE